MQAGTEFSGEHGRSTSRRRVTLIRLLSSVLFCLFAITFTGLPPQNLSAAEPATTTEQLQQARALLKQAGQHYRQGELAECAADLVKIRAALDAATATNRAQRDEATRLNKSWQKARRLLAMRGINVPDATSPPTTSPSVEGPTNTDDQAAAEKATAGVSFTRDLAPHLVKHCAGCHGSERQRGRLRLDTFANLIKGGQRGRLIDTSKPNDSLLLRKLKGTADGQQMPVDGEPFSDELIQKFASWVAAGAKYDGQNPNADLAAVVAAARRAAMSPEQRAAELDAAVHRNWRLAFPGATPNLKRTKQFVLIAERPSPELDALGRRLDEAATKARQLLQVESGSTETDASIPVYVLARRYDYAEFMQMVLRREASSGEFLHWHGTSDDSYLVLGPEPDERKSTQEARLARYVTAVMLNRWGAPEWYADGIGRAVFGKLDRRHPEVRSWQATAKQVLRTVKKPNALLEATMPASSVGVAQWAFGTALFGQSRSSGRLHKLLSEGNDFDLAFRREFGNTPQAVCNSWLLRHGGGTRPKRKKPKPPKKRPGR